MESHDHPRAKGEEMVSLILELGGGRTPLQELSSWSIRATARSIKQGEEWGRNILPFHFFYS